MKRLFITLYVVIVLTAFGFMFGLNPTINYALDNAITAHSYTQFSSTFFLLDERLAGTDNQVEELAEIKTLFEYDVSLLSLPDVELSKKKKQRLLSNSVVGNRVEEGYYIYALSTKQPEMVWRLQIAQTSEQVTHDAAIGAFRMGESYLLQLPRGQWRGAIDFLGKELDLPLSLHSKQSPEIKALNDQQIAILQQKRVLVINNGEPDEYHMYRIGDSDQFAKSGPTPLPFTIRFLAPLIFFIIAVLFALSIYLWLRPLWSNLYSLEQASLAFGQGEFDSRARMTRFSPIKSISSSFNHMARRVQSLISSHKDLTNAVSHELRTPLARMRFGLEMLESARDKQDQQRFIKEMATDIDELDVLINELLTYARFERSQPEIELKYHKVVPWLEQQVDRAQKLSDKIRIGLHCEGISRTQTFAFEDRLLARALSNLLRNAINYAEHQVDVVFKQSTEEFCLMVDDDGCGVAQDKRESIFDPFKHVDESRNRDTGGFGIGLAIVQQVAQWHSGSASVVGSPLGGARFIIRIPRS